MVPARTLRTMAPGLVRHVDALGVLSVGALAGWALHVGGPGAGSFLGLLAGLVAAVGVGRWIGQVRPGAVEAAIGAAVAAAVALTVPGITQAGGPPTGYGNANATLVGVGLVAAIAAARTHPRRERWRWGVVVGLAAALVATGSLAGLVSAAFAGGLLAAAARARYRPILLVGGPILVAIGLAVTSGIAIGDLGGIADVEPVRSSLWAAAVDVLRSEPWSGVGVGGFAELNAVSADADLRWVHHEYLELAVELGVVGLLLVLALLGWAFARLSAAVRPEAAGAAVTLVALHGTVDHVWHAPAVLVLTALLVGAAGETAAAWAPRTIAGARGES